MTRPCVGSRAQGSRVWPPCQGRRFAAPLLGRRVAFPCSGDTRAGGGEHAIRGGLHRLFLEGPVVWPLAFLRRSWKHLPWPPGGCHGARATPEVEPAVAVAAARSPREHGRDRSLGKGKRVSSRGGGSPRPGVGAEHQSGGAENEDSSEAASVQEWALPVTDDWPYDLGRVSHLCAVGVSAALRRSFED